MSATRDIPYEAVAKSYDGRDLRKILVPLYDPFLAGHYKETIAFAVQNKLVRRSFEPAEIFDTKFADAALKSLGLEAYWAPLQAPGGPIGGQSTMSTSQGLSSEAIAFVTAAQKDARKAFRVLRETRIISPSGTLSFTARIPAEEKLVNLGYTGPWGDDLDEVETSVVGFDGKSYWGKAPLGGEGRYTKLFVQHKDVQAISHVHAPYLGAYAQVHSTLPLLYVPNRRYRFTAELPVYIDRRQAEVDFIVETVNRDNEVPGIVEANGGSTIWSKKGILDLANTILFLEEGAQFQVLAAALGGSKPFGPGVLQQQWRMGGLIPSTAIVDQDGTIHHAAAE